jgi:twitching motility protein PilT
LINEILRAAKSQGASDVHLKSEKRPFDRVHGELKVMENWGGDSTHPLTPSQQEGEMNKRGSAPNPVSLTGGILTPEILREFVKNSCPAAFLPRWKKDSQVDYSYVAMSDEGKIGAEKIGRYRVSAFYQRGTPSIVFRHVKEEIPTLASLNLEPKVFESLCGLEDGIVLLCGPTGSGKSSTLAAMLNHVNETQRAHVITLEDPIEYAYTDKNCIFNQREVGIDTPNFADGLKVALRQDPDIILVGEMRDRETFETALTAAETGHLVFGTLHSGNAQQAVQRLFEFFDPAEQASRRRQIASTLQATITQKLLPAVKGGRVPAVEIFRMDALGRRIIEAGEFEKVSAVMEAGKDVGSRSFNADLYRLIQAGAIAKDVGLQASPNPKALEMNLRGIFLSQGGIVG